MHRVAVLHLLPWLLLVIGLGIALRWIVALGGGRWQGVRFRRLHRDESGAVQTLSFVLTLPFFVMTLLLIVQASQLMVGQMVVEYAAVATVRAAHGAGFPRRRSIRWKARTASAITRSTPTKPTPAAARGTLFSRAVPSISAFEWAATLAWR